jgi:hypothetical protein
MRAGSGRRLAHLLALVPLAVGCASTPDERRPDVPAGTEAPAVAPEGPEVVVVLPAPDALAPEVTAEARDRLRSAVGAVAGVRVVVPEGSAGLGDVLAAVVADDVDLVCLVGAGAGAAIAQTTTVPSGTTLCTLPAPILAPARTLTVDVPLVAFGRSLAEVALVAAAGGDVAVLGTLGAPVNGETDVVAAVRRGLVEASAIDPTGLDGDPDRPSRALPGQGRGRVGLRLTEADVPAAEAVAALPGPIRVVVIDGSPGSGALLEAALAAGLLVVAPSALTDALAPEDRAGVVAGWRIAWEVGVLAALERVTADPQASEPDAGAVATASTLLRVRAGAAAGAAVRALIAGSGLDG